MVDLFTGTIYLIPLNMRSAQIFSSSAMSTWSLTTAIWGTESAIVLQACMTIELYFFVPRSRVGRGCKMYFRVTFLQNAKVFYSPGGQFSASIELQKYRTIEHFYICRKFEVSRDARCTFVSRFCKTRENFTPQADSFQSLQNNRNIELQRDLSPFLRFHFSPSRQFYFSTILLFQKQKIPLVEFSTFPPEYNNVFLQFYSSTALHFCISAQIQ